MRRSAKVIAGVALLVVLAVAIFAAVLWQDPNRFRPQLVSLLNEATGMPVALDGPMQWTLHPELALQASQVSLNASALNVRIDRLVVQARIGELLSGDLRLRRLAAIGVTVDLRPDGSSDASDNPTGGSLGNRLGNGPGNGPGNGNSSLLKLLDPATLPFDLLEIESLRVQREARPWFAVERVAVDGSTRGAVIPVELTVDAALVANGQLHINDGRLQFSDLLVRTPAGELRGTLSVDADAWPPQINAKLSAERLTVRSVSRGPSAGLMIPRLPLNLNELKSIDGQLELAVGTLAVAMDHNHELQLKDLVLPAKLSSGSLALSAKAALDGGSIAFDAEVNAVKRHWRSRINISGANAGKLAKLLNVSRVRAGGVVNFQAALDANGKHTDELLRSLRGTVALRLADVSIDSDVSQLAGADVLVGLMQMLRGNGSRPVDLRCAVADFTVRDGIMRGDDSIGIQTDLLNMLGGGVIGLPDERMDLLIRPWPRSGVGLSVTALSGAVSVSGPVISPRFALTDEAFWRTGASAGAAVLTGGLSLIAQGLLERARGDTPCELAMGRQKVERGRRDVAQSVGQTVSDSTKRVTKSVTDGSRSAAKSAGRGADNVSRAVTKGVQSVGRSLKNFFGSGGGSSRSQESPQDRN